MKIKGLVAAGIIASSLIVMPAIALPDNVENDARQDTRDLEDVKEKEPEKKDQEKRDVEKKDLEKGDIEKKDLEKRDDEKKDLEKGDVEKKDFQKNGEKWDRKKGYEEFVKDPITVLENRKSEVLKLLEEGKVSKEKADAIVKRIETGIAEVKAFNRLSLDKKRAKLIKDCKDYLDSVVEKGDMEMANARKLLEDYSKKINKWDGTGYPKFFRKGIRHKQ